MGIYDAMQKVMRDIGTVGKNRKNERQNYQYRSVDDIISALSPALSEHGVVIVPAVTDYEASEQKYESGAIMQRVTVQVSYKFYAPDGSMLEAIVVGHAMDSGDKAYGKALTAAYKSMALQVFCIAADEPPDQGAKPPKPLPDIPLREIEEKEQKISREQANGLFALSGNNAKLCAEVIRKYGYASSADIKKSDYEKIQKEIDEAANGNKAKV